VPSEKIVQILVEAEMMQSGDLQEGKRFEANNNIALQEAIKTLANIS
jgi:hypothetical protein